MHRLWKERGNGQCIDGVSGEKTYVAGRNIFAELGVLTASPAHFRPRKDTSPRKKPESAVGLDMRECSWAQ